MTSTPSHRSGLGSSRNVNDMNNMKATRTSLELKKDKRVRFYNDEKQDGNFSWEKSDPTQRNLKEPLSGDRAKKTPRFRGFKVFPENHEPHQKKVLDPGSDILLNWNTIFLISCLLALFVDPLFFYLPYVHNDDSSSCMAIDLKLGIVVTCFRTLADTFYLLNMFIKSRTAYISPKTRVFGRGELVMDPKKISRRYLRSSDFFIDLIATLPLPQIVIWFIIPAVKSSTVGHTHNALVMIVLLQYVPRSYLIFPLSSQIIRATGVVTETAWAGAAYNLILYMLASHVLGASWYLFSIERYATCWKSQCRMEIDPIKCFLSYLDCGSLNNHGRRQWINSTNVFSNCNPDNSTGFNYGIFQNALTNNAVSSSFLEKYLFCFWWGLQNLSCNGQNLTASTFIGETSFAILIATMGLVLFAHLIGNMQTYLQSITVRLEEWRLRRRDTEEWMRHRQLPQDLQERVRRFVQYKWLATRGVDEESILHALPTDLRRDIKRHLCLDLVRRVPFFSQMDGQLLDAICERLVSSLSTQGTYIVREGDPVTEMLLIIRGKLESSTTNGGRTGFFNSNTLRPGDFCGEELLAWALLPNSTLNLPSSTRTVRSLDEVEAFALRAEDLKFVANQFRRLHSKKLQHTFRFYSYHWRTWAACFIQVAWRQFKKRLLAKNLSMVESFSYNSDNQEADEAEQEKEEYSRTDAASNASQARQNLGVTIVASWCAAKTRRGQLPKPEEPDFSVDD